MMWGKAMTGGGIGAAPPSCEIYLDFSATFLLEVIRVKVVRRPVSQATRRSLTRHCHCRYHPQPSSAAFSCYREKGLRHLRSEGSVRCQLVRVLPRKLSRC